MTGPLAASRDDGAAAYRAEEATTGEEQLTPADDATVTVFYDGACPLCAAEIGYYRGRQGSEAISWVDVSACHDPEVVPGLQRELALKRFHVRTASGELISGGRAFAVLWSALPGFRWIGKAFRSGAPARLIDWLYNRFLRWRPYLQSFARRRLAHTGRGKIGKRGR